MARSNVNKANLSPAKAGARLSMATRLDILKKITIPVVSTGSGLWGWVGWINWILG